MVMGLTLAIVILILASAAMASVVIGKRQEQRRRNLSVIGRMAASGTGDNRDKALAKQRADIARKLKEAGQDAGGKKEKDKDKTTIKELMIQAGFEAPTSRYWIGSAIFAVIFVLLLKLITSWPAIALVFAGVAGFLGIPKMFLKIKAGKRQKKFLEEFADALDGSVRLLQAGMPISEAIAMVSREYTGPLKEEMLRIYDNQRIGVPLGEAAAQTAKRIPLPEVHMFATALQIQSETGSSLSEVLSNLSAVIRARFKLKRKIKALSSEAKASAGIIGALPILVSLGLYAVNPTYIGILFSSTKGNIILSMAIFWMTCGMLVMRAMINFKI